MRTKIKLWFWVKFNMVSKQGWLLEVNHIWQEFTVENKQTKYSLVKLFDWTRWQQLDWHLRIGWRVHPTSVPRRRIALLLMKNGIWKFTEKTLPIPTNATQLVEHNKKNVKAKRIILDAMKDHVIPHLSGKKTTR